MSSLIDVSFLLLIYFIATSSIRPKESDIGLTMPPSIRNAVGKFDFDPMYIKVNSNNEIYLNEERVEMAQSGRNVPQLLDRLRTYVQSNAVLGDEPIVKISASDGANSQRFIDVLNALADKKVGITHIDLEMNGENSE